MSEPIDRPVLLDVADGVATITFNRPDAMNSLDVATKEALLDAVRSVADDPAARCVVLTGTGRAFCVGQDLKQHIEILQSESSDQLFRTVDEHYNPIVTTLAGMAKPVIAAVNGVAAGAGASLAFACDLRIVADTAGFNLAFAGVALSCDTGSSFTLQRLVGPARAIELLYQPRTIKADEALALGLATRVVPAASLAEEVSALAASLAAGPTVAFGAMRRSVAYAAGHTFEEALAFESSMMTLTGATADHAAAVHAFVEQGEAGLRGALTDPPSCASEYADAVAPPLHVSCASGTPATSRAVPDALGVPEANSAVPEAQLGRTGGATRRAHGRGSAMFVPRQAPKTRSTRPGATRRIRHRRGGRRTRP